MSKITGKILSAKLMPLQAEGGREILDVEIALIEGDKTIDKRRLGLDPDLSESDLKAQVKAYVDNYAAETKAAVENAKRDKQQAEVAEKINNLTGLKI